MPGIDRYTSLMLHCNGTPGSTVFTDSSSNAVTFTSSGAISIVSSVVKFSNCSGAFGGGITTTPDSASLTLGSSDFTIDFWFYSQLNRGGSSATTLFLFGQSNSAGTLGLAAYGRTIAASDALLFAVSSDGSSSPSTISTPNLSLEVFNHAALVRSGSTLSVYINGSQVGTAAFTGSIADSSYNFAFGGLGEVTANRYVGFMDELRYSAGVARWTANFTPPVVPYDQWLTDWGLNTGVGGGGPRKVKVVGY